MNHYPTVETANHVERLTLEWSGNWAALVGVVICLALLWLWVDRNSISLNSGKREWEE